MSITRTDIVKSLAKILPADGVVVNEQQRNLFAADIAYESNPPLVIATPHSVDELAAVVKTLAKLGVPYAPRGAGLSYSKGYLVETADWVAIDLRKLNRIHEINTIDGYVTLDAGCTWQQLAQALEAVAMRPPFWGPYSGRDATIGATMAQNAIFYGSALHGTIAESTLGVTVILSDGSRLSTGSAASQSNPSPFFRHLGPDLTGLFVGACGAFGIIATVTLALHDAPQAVVMRGYSFDKESDMVDAMQKLGRARVASECMSFDPAMLSRTAPRNTLTERHAGRWVAEGQGFLISAVIEGATMSATEDAAGRADQIARDIGCVRVSEGILASMRAIPFREPTTLIGPGGARWLPVHAIVPHSRHLEVVHFIYEFMDANARPLVDEGLTWGFVSTLIGHSAVLVEPSFYWPDKPSQVAYAYLDEPSLNHASGSNPKLRAAVLKLRRSLSLHLAQKGAVNLQIGRTYPFVERLNPANVRLLEAIKWALDPSGLSNPGVLGLASPTHES